MVTPATKDKKGPLIEGLESMRVQAHQGGGEKRVERQHAKGKLTARERLRHLLDLGTFYELDEFVTHRATDFAHQRTYQRRPALVVGVGGKTLAYFESLRR